MKMYGGVDLEIHAFLASALVGDQWSASRPDRFNQGKESPIHTKYEAGWAPESVWTSNHIILMVAEEIIYYTEIF
jgi:hypothetical protein